MGALAPALPKAHFRLGTALAALARPADVRRRTFPSDAARPALTPLLHCAARAARLISLTPSLGF
eukprot:3547127-Prymnesium_polylepis.1